MNRRLNTIKKITILALIVFVFILIINIFWLITMYVPYSGYIGKVDKKNTELGPVYEKKLNELNYKVSPTPYLGYDAFLSVSKDYRVYLDENGNIISDNLDITLFVWPNIWTGYEYGIMFLNEHDNVFIQVMVDENGEYIPYDKSDIDFNSDVEKYFVDNKTEINNLLKAAKVTWGLTPMHDIKEGINQIISNRKVVCVICLIACIIFMIIKLFNWVFNVKMPFYDYIKEMEKVSRIKINNKKVNYQKNIGTTQFYAKKPNLLKQNGSISVKNTYDDLETMLIYFPKKEKYYFYVNEKMCYCKSKREEQGVLSNSQKNVFSNLKLKANEFWGLDLE